MYLTTRKIAKMQTSAGPRDSRPPPQQVDLTLLLRGKKINSDLSLKLTKLINLGFKAFEVTEQERALQALVAQARRLGGALCAQSIARNIRNECWRVMN